MPIMFGCCDLAAASHLGPHGGAQGRFSKVEIEMRTITYISPLFLSFSLIKSILSTAFGDSIACRYKWRELLADSTS